MPRWLEGCLVALVLLVLQSPAHAVTLMWDYTQGSDPAVQFNLYKQPGCTGAATIVQTQSVPPGTSTNTATVDDSNACYTVTAQTESAPSNSVHVGAPVPTPGVLNAPTNLRR